MESNNDLQTEEIKEEKKEEMKEDNKQENKEEMKEDNKQENNEENKEEKKEEKKEENKEEEKKEENKKEENKKEEEKKVINDFESNENIKSTINHIITLGNSIPSFFLEQDLDMFIIKCVSKLGKNSIEKSKVINSLKKIFQYYENLKEIKLTIKEQSIDKFKCHGNEEINLKDKSSYYNEILQNLEMFLNSGYEFEKEDLDDLISSIENTPFYLIKIKLIEMKKDYLNCLNVFLLNLDKFESRKIFEWINNTFSLLNKKENNGLVENKENLQKAILDKLQNYHDYQLIKQ